jgi:hypothetical protein
VALSPANEPWPEGAARRRYALWLAWGTGVGFALLVAAFGAYALGIVPAHVPLERLPELWGLSSTEFRARTGIPAGWGWSALVHRSDVANVAVIAVLATWSMACITAILPIFLARRWWLFVAICAMQLAVLGLAASGLFTRGH